MDSETERVMHLDTNEAPVLVLTLTDYSCSVVMDSFLHNREISMLQRHAAFTAPLISKYLNPFNISDRGAESRPLSPLKSLKNTAYPGRHQEGKKAD